MKIILGFLAVIFLTANAFAAPVSFEKLQDFHDTRLDMLLSNYGLEGDLDISVLISPAAANGVDNYKNNSRVRLPGMLLGGIEDVSSDSVGVFEIVQSLKDYKRDVTIIKKKNVSNQEIDALRSGIKDYLALRDGETIRVQDSVFSLSNAMKNWSGDLQEAVYTSFFQSKIWSWIPFTILVVFLFSVFFASSFKGAFKDLGESIERSAGLDPSGGSLSAGDMGNFDNLSAEDDFKDIIETEVDQVFEVDPLSILEKVLELYTTSQFELFNVLWSFLPSVEKQISFYELLSPEADALQAESFKSIFFEAFKLSPASISNMKAGEFLTGQELARLHKTLLCAQLVDVDPRREEALAAVFPQYGNSLGKLIEASLEQFFSVVYFLFPEKVLDMLTANPETSKKVSSKIAFHLAKPEDQRAPGELEIKSFVSFLGEEKFLKRASLISLDEKTVRLLYSIPDSAIFNTDSWSEDYKNHILQTIPNVQWLILDNPLLLKKFFLTITEEEMFYVSEEHPEFSRLFDILDERGRLRIQEKINRGSRSEEVMSTALFRAKIKKVFKPLVLGSGDDLQAEDISNAA